MFLDRQLTALQPVLNIPYVRRVRRNHGLEHATIHLLAARYPGLRIVGRSDARGFILIGDLPTEQVEEQVNRALARMRNGEHQLAIHPNCGTNLVTIALIGAILTFTLMLGSEREPFFTRLSRIPLIALGIMGAVIFGQPLGMRLQQHVSTLGNPADLEIRSITRRRHGRLILHRVETWSN
ncbi:MAG: hypothetical protein IT326_09745 [Anaerolineae bacterium]|nr:hypothetical protein [Anaerolineae bacterium]